MSPAVDVLVVGAGVVGLSIAIDLSEDPALKIVVLDKGGPGGGTSGRSAGVICRHDQGPSYQRLSLFGHARYRQLAGEGHISFNAWGHLTIVRGDRAFPPPDPFADEFADAPSGMYARDILDHDATIQRFPWLRDSDVVGSVFEPNIGFIDPLELIEFYRALLSSRPNVQVRFGDPVLGFRSDGPRISRALSRRGDWAPGVVVNATGAWAPKLASLAGTSVAITPQRINVAAALEYQPSGSEVPLHGVAGMSWEGDGVWARGEVGGATLFGQHRDLTAPEYPAVDPDFFDGVADQGFVERLRPIVGALYRMSPESVVRGWTCVYDTSPDGFPLIGIDSSIPNLVHAVGMNGHGMTIHPGVARCVADLVMFGRTVIDVSDVMPGPEQLDFRNLRPSRFDDGEPLVIGHG